MHLFPLLLLFLLVFPTGAVVPRCSDGVLVCWSDRIEETIEMMAGRDTERYNCSTRTVTEWRATGQVRPVLGVYYMASGVAFIVIGVSVLFIFWKHGTSNQYKLMMFIGFIEVTEVSGVSIWPGVAAWFGDVYCTNPRMSTIFGKITMVQWITGTSAVILLGIRRLLDITKSHASFSQSKQSLAAWMAVCLLYGVWGSFCFDTVLFNSAFMAPLLDPRIQDESPFVYENTMLRVHNTLFSILLIVIYTSIVATWYYYRKYRYSSHYFNAYERSILIQSIAISATYAPPALSFVAIYFIASPSKWIVLLSDLSYQLSGGLPFIMIITVNKSVREHLKRLFKTSPTSIATVHTISTQIIA